MFLPCDNLAWHVHIIGLWIVCVCIKYIDIKSIWSKSFKDLTIFELRFIFIKSAIFFMFDLNQWSLEKIETDRRHTSQANRNGRYYLIRNPKKKSSIYQIKNLFLIFDSIKKQINSFFPLSTVFLQSISGLFTASPEIIYFNSCLSISPE